MSVSATDPQALAAQILSQNSTPADLSQQNLQRSRDQANKAQTHKKEMEALNPALLSLLTQSNNAKATGSAGGVASGALTPPTAPTLPVTSEQRETLQGVHQDFGTMLSTASGAQKSLALLPQNSDGPALSANLLSLITMKLRFNMNSSDLKEKGKMVEVNDVLRKAQGKIQVAQQHEAAKKLEKAEKLQKILGVFMKIFAVFTAIASVLAFIPNPIVAVIAKIIEAVMQAVQAIVKNVMQLAISKKTTGAKTNTLTAKESEMLGRIAQTNIKSFTDDVQQVQKLHQSYLSEIEGHFDQKAQLASQILSNISSGGK